MDNRMKNEDVILPPIVYINSKNRIQGMHWHSWVIKNKFSGVVYKNQHQWLIYYEGNLIEKLGYKKDDIESVYARIELHKNNAILIEKINLTPWLFSEQILTNKKLIVQYYFQVDNLDSNICPLLFSIKKQTGSTIFKLAVDNTFCRRYEIGAGGAPQALKNGFRRKKEIEMYRDNTDKIFFVIVLLFCVVLVGTCAMKFVSSEGSATNNAMKYREVFHPDWQGAVVSCQSYDTDNNGYVSCTIGATNHNPEAIECPVKFSLNDSCRPARNMVPNQTNNNNN